MKQSCIKHKLKIYLYIKTKYNTTFYPIKKLTLFCIQTNVIHYRASNGNSFKTDKTISPLHLNKIVCIISNIKIILFIFREKKDNYQQFISLITINKKYFSNKFLQYF